VIDIEIATNYRSARQTECSMGGVGFPGLIEGLLYLRPGVKWSARRGFLIADVSVPSGHAGAQATGPQLSGYAPLPPAKPIATGGGSKGSLLSWLLFIALIPFALAHLFARKLGEALR